MLSTDTDLYQNEFLYSFDDKFLKNVLFLDVGS